MILGFFGSRTLSGKAIRNMIDLEVGKHRPEYIVTSGGIDGVCDEVERYCKRNALPIKLHYPNKAKYGRGMYDMRSKTIIGEADFLILIHDGNSPGTRHELELVKKLDKPFTYHLIEASERELELEKVSL
jgi:hypothetical protein